MWESSLLESVDYELNQAHAAIFLHCLLAQHHCVKRVEFLQSPRAEKGSELLVCDALTSTTSVTCLNFSVCKFNVEATSVAITAICRLLTTTLRELTMQTVQLAVRTGASLHALAEGIAHTSTLKILKLFCVDVVSEESSAADDLDFPGATLHALANNRSLSTLRVDDSFCTHKDGSTFKAMLGLPCAPIKLTVYGHKPEYCDKASLLFDALLSNKSVDTLDLQRFSLGRSDAISLSKLVSENYTIQDIDCSKSIWDMRPTEEENEEEGIRWHAQSLSTGLQATKALRRLTLPYDFTTNEMRHLLQAARECKPLQELHFPWTTLERAVPLLQRLKDVTNPQQITVGMFREHVGATLVAHLRAASAIITDKQNPPADVPSRYKQDSGQVIPLCSEYIVPSLHLRAKPDDVNLEFAQAFGDYLSLTRTLRSLHMDFDAASLACSHAIIGGLVQNDSIEDLSIFNLCVGEEDVSALCAWLSRSRRVYRLTLWIGVLRTKLAVENLATLLHDSYTLSSLAVYDILLDSRLGQTLKNQVLRNDGLVKCATGFVLGSCLKRAAVGFELVSWHPQLNATVQRIGSVDEVAAEKDIREAVRRLRKEFWKLAGIVETRITCHELPEMQDLNSSRRYQFHELGFDVLYIIRSFLKVGDVLDDEEEEKRAGDTAKRMSRKRKRNS